MGCNKGGADKGAEGSKTSSSNEEGRANTVGETKNVHGMDRPKKKVGGDVRAPASSANADHR